MAIATVAVMASRAVDIAERRARLGRRHLLAEGGAGAVDAARAVVALHSTDPASMSLSVLARAPAASIADVERALYEERSLIRVLAMRRTVFAVPADLVQACLAATADSVAGPQRRQLEKLLVASGVTDDGAGWLARARAAAMEFVESSGEFTSRELAAADPLLATRLEVSAGTVYATTQSVASRLLTLLSSEGAVVRARPAGGWTSTQFRWVALDRWRGDLGDRPPTEVAAAEIARRWLRSHGPATPADLQWWTGWTKRLTTAALGRLETVEVDLDGSPGLLLADDREAVAAPEPWVALAPALDPSAMGWRHREWFLGPHGPAVYDLNGNAGPTVWVDGRVVGGWAIRDDGEVVARVLEDVGAQARATIDDRAARLQERLGGAVVRARARGWSAVERELRA
jgi:DNA glycosylase AlkZ-like